MPKDINRIYKERDDFWQTYEVVLQDAYFEWPAPIAEDEQLAKARCTEYLDMVFLRGRYRMEKFYLKRGVATTRK